MSKQSIVVTELPLGYLDVRSGTGTAAAGAIVVLPVLFEGESLGVIELGATTPFSALHLTFLERLVTTIGVALATIQAGRRTEQLLAQSQRLTTELQDQSAELQRTNAELEEKALQLSEQNRNVELKNMEIDAARRGVEEKAQQLALANQYKSEFLANMSHELRTPLNSLLLLSRLLADNRDSNLTPKQTEFARTIHASASELLHLIEDILDLSKIEAGRVDIQPAAVELAEVCAVVEQAFGVQAEDKGLELRVETAAELPGLITTDAQRLQQILRNLLANAIKFTDAGSVTLQVGLAPPRTLHGVPSLDGARSVVTFAVRDTGIGIPGDKLAMIFEAFQQADGTTSRKYGGTGLGLSISKELAGLLGGKIEVSSEPGAGSVFTLLLPDEFPAASGTPARRPAEAPPEAAERGEPILRTVAVDGASGAGPVRDHGAHRRRRRAQRLRPHQRAGDARPRGPLRRQRPRRHRPAHRAPGGPIVLMDAMMPDLDGNATTRRIRPPTVAGTSDRVPDGEGDARGPGVQPGRGRHRLRHQARRPRRTARDHGVMGDRQRDATARADGPAA